ncbi:MAG: 4Fe-4S binding protein [Candidatus Hydrogenedentes bacterium]|nr:4Fe-4S binding protein [Candidatus Hydrogenedentota bacterium]
MKRPKKSTVIKIALLVALPLIALWSFPRALGILLPALSPFLGLTSVLTTRTVGITLLAVLPMTALIVWMRRFFCRFLCPVGYVSETCGKISPQPWRGYLRLPRLGQGVALFTLGGAFSAVPFFLFLDPLALFIGAVGTATYWAYGLCFAGVVLISLLFPGLWCARLCPLGACQDLAVDLKDLAVGKWSGKPVPAGNAGQVPRRIFLGVCGGAATATLVNHLQVTGESPSLLRPPGAADELTMRALCVRCGSCVRACPETILHPDLTPPDLTGLLLPVVRFKTGHCLDDCARCGEACPTGAIACLPVAEKNERKIGLARVDQEACLLSREIECGICAAVCKRGAVVEAFSKDSYTASIRIDTDRCNGCGACVNICPPRAITIMADTHD